MKKKHGKGWYMFSGTWRPYRYGSFNKRAGTCATLKRMR